MEHFKTNRVKPGILHEGFRFRKDRDSKTEPRRPIFLPRGSNTSSWPRKSCEYIGASVTPKLSTNAPLLCAQVYDRRKRNFCKMSANVIAPRKLCCNLSKIQTKRPSLWVFCKKDKNGIANSEDPDQTAPPLGAV